jgi:MFS family permease
MAAANPVSDSFAPLRQSAFAVLWVATVLGNTGTFMRDVASAWLVTDLSASPMAVALIQVAGTLPIFLLAIPAGVLSDILDRRRLLIGIQVLLAAVSATLMVLAHTQLISVSSLIALTLVGGIGAALMGPVWQSIVPELVPRVDLRNAVALNSLGINISRSIGPALGGVLLATFGAAFTYGMDVLSYVLVISALLWWRRPAHAADELPEQFAGALRAGLRYARASRELHRVILRAIGYFLFASALWALLPLVARNLLRGDAAFYGLLLGAVGVGAIAGAILLPRLRGRLDADGLMLAAAFTTAIVMGLLALAPPRWLALALLLLLGLAWIVTLTTLNATAQAILPNWVRGRGLAIYLTVFNGSMAGGSLAWGIIAQQLGVASTLLIGGAGLVVLAIVLHRYKLPSGAADLMPSNHWPEPLVAAPVESDRGPVLVLIHYRVRQSDRNAFLSALGRLSDQRRRDGASAWGVTEDANEPTHIVEWFVVESWAEHLRQHQRVSHADADVQRELLQYQINAAPPVVEHFLTLDVPHAASPPRASSAEQ